MDVGEVINIGIVIPVLGKAEDVSAWLKVAEESDVVVEAVADYSNAATSGILAKALTELQQRKPQITIIYTSGTWVCIPPHIFVVICKCSLQSTKLFPLFHIACIYNAHRSMVPVLHSLMSILQQTPSDLLLGAPL